MNKLQMQLGFVLILLALVTGLLIPALTNHRLGLSSHLAGITGGLVLVALGAINGAFMLSPRAVSVMMWSWTYAAYANWFALLLSGITGASGLTPMAGAETSGSPAAETLVAALLYTLVLASLLGTGLAVWGLRGDKVGSA